MRLSRIAVLLRKEFTQGPKNFMFFWALVVPLVISIAISLTFGSLFSHEPSLGIVDEGNSQLAGMIADSPSVNSRGFDSIAALKAAVTEGTVDGGVVLPEGFDNAVMADDEVEVSFYLWGESLAKDRTLLAITLTDSVRELSGKESPVEIQTISLGNEEAIPWKDRLLPFVVLMTITTAGIALSGTSFLQEKEKKTLDALAVTPTTIEEVVLAKGLLGVIMGLFMGIVILIVNQSMGSQPGLLVMVLLLGTIMASAMGLLLASLVKDIMTFFASIKIIGLLLYAPVIIYLFPSLPQWIGNLFPTYYIVEPIVEVSQRGGGWAQIAPEVITLVVLNVVIVGLVAFILKKKKQYAV